MMNTIIESLKNKLACTLVKVKAFLKTLFKVLAVLVVITATVIVVKNLKSDRDNTKAVVKIGTAVKVSINGENKVDDYMIMEELYGIGELGTSKFTYVGSAEIKDSNVILGVTVPFTTHTIDIVYSGTIKAGFNIEDVIVTVSDGVINVTLPEIIILDNYINQEDVECIESNSIFNPIESDEVTNFLVEKEAEELQIALDNGLLEEAEKQAKSIIMNSLKKYIDDGYIIIINGQIMNTERPTDLGN